ncbi:MULE domain-containing protein [Aphis craccivora]|uniref:MULE domain-containing protein n=1 Tax=Aphis craccivora TaxID=307492 RepID=A0A6G0YHI6_APHCR|nr:MULE domain-containing protein [Aphis craccivora]
MHITEFKSWKHNKEQATFSKFITDRVMAKINHLKSKQFYYCHRSYSYRKKGSDIREIKSMGTNKIGGVCPSMLKVTILKCDETEKVHVKYWKTHCGHP